MEDLNEMQNQPEKVEEAANTQPMAEKSAENIQAAEPTAQTETETPKMVQESDAPVAEPTTEEPTKSAEPEVAAETVEAEKEAAAPVDKDASAAENTDVATEPEYVEPEVDYTNQSREELLNSLKELMQEDVTHIRTRVAGIKATFAAANKELQKVAFEEFLAAGGNKDDYKTEDDALAEAFRKVYNEYRERRQKHTDEVEAQKQKNLEQKRTILDELKNLIEGDDTMKKAYDDFNALQERWKAIGEVPRESVDDLWQNYHFLIEQFFNKVKINKELKMLDMKKNLEQKIVLCEKAEELIVEPSVIKAFKSLQDLRDQWKEIGPVPTEQNDEIWSRFCNAADQVSTRHREYFEQRREEMDKNLLAKQALIEKAKELVAETPASIKQWNDVSAALDELLKVWKTIGPVPREQNEEIWKQFKGTIDTFYTHKKEYFDTLKDEQTDNYNKKIDLCLKAEAVAKREDWKKATEELLQLQAEWKSIGTVSRKYSDKIWQRFRGACDEFFAKKGQYYSHIKENEKDNMAKKEAIIAQLKAYEFGEDKEENLRVIKDFQRQWMEIGFVPMNEKERLKNEFREVINSHFEKLKISIHEAEENAFRERVRNVGNDSKRFVNSERDDLQNKIEKLRNDIKLWENNLGFLNDSKQADLLKNEFQKKMQSARQQIALMEAKVRILRESQAKAEETKSADKKPKTEEPKVEE